MLKVSAKYRMPIIMRDSIPHPDGLDAAPPPIRVSATSITKSVAGSIAHRVREHGFAEIQAIGAPAVNQAIKAIAAARAYVQETDQFDLVCTPQFIEVAIDDQERTAIRFVAERRP